VERHIAVEMEKREKRRSGGAPFRRRREKTT
jgi:hypothetical protein